MLSAAEQSRVVKLFWAFMLEHYGATTCRKSQSELMRLAAAVLEGLGIQSKETFLTKFTTTVCTFSRTIYTSFEVGASFDLVRAWDQMRVLCHECQHIVQAQREGWPRFDALYLASSSFRAGYEAEAFGVDMEMEAWLLGAAFDPRAYARSRAGVLKSYGCSQADIDQAVEALSIRAEVVGVGGVETDAAQTAIVWLETNVPNLRRVI